MDKSVLGKTAREEPGSNDQQRNASRLVIAMISIILGRPQPPRAGGPNDFPEITEPHGASEDGSQSDCGATHSDDRRAEEQKLLLKDANDVRKVCSFAKKDGVRTSVENEQRVTPPAYRLLISSKSGSKSLEFEKERPCLICAQVAVRGRLPSHISYV